LLIDQRGRQNDAGNVLFYLGSPTGLGPIIGRSAAPGSRDSQERLAAVIVEKPFGHDWHRPRPQRADPQGAVRRQIYRIDSLSRKERSRHLVLRSPTALRAAVDPRPFDHVQITAAETSVSTPRPLLEKTGALRGHGAEPLFQLLAMIAMEPPISFDADAVRAKKTELFQAIHPISPPMPFAAIWRQRGVAKSFAITDMSRVAPDSQPRLMSHFNSASTTGAGRRAFYLRTGKSLCAATPRSRCNLSGALMRSSRHSVDRLPATSDAAHSTG